MKSHWLRLCPFQCLPHSLNPVQVKRLAFLAKQLVPILMPLSTTILTVSLWTLCCKACSFILKGVMIVRHISSFLIACVEMKIHSPASISADSSMNGGAVSCQARNPLTRVESPIAQVPIKVRFFEQVDEERRHRVLFRFDGIVVRGDLPFRTHRIQ